MGGRWEVQWVGGGKNKEKKIKHTVTTCLKRHHSIGTKVCLGTTLPCMYACNAATKCTMFINVLYLVVHTRQHTHDIVIDIILCESKYQQLLPM